MSKLSCIIIDDELHSRETTKMFLDMVCPEVEVVGSYSNGVDGAKAINEMYPDFAILDIQMPKVSGIEMLSLIPNYEGEIIFLTAHNQYAIDAFKKGALHYLLKPLDPEELKSAVARVKKQATSNKSSDGNWISISDSEGWVVIRKSEIVRCESYKNYTTIFTKDQKYTISKTLKEVEQKVSNSNFYRVHHSHLISILHVERIIKSDGGNVLMTNGNLIPISKNKKKDFFEWFKSKVDAI